jgi:hypothetical protein
MVHGIGFGVASYLFVFSLFLFRLGRMGFAEDDGLLLWEIYDRLMIMMKKDCSFCPSLISFPVSVSSFIFGGQSDGIMRTRAESRGWYCPPPPPWLFSSFLPGMLPDLFQLS